MKPWADRLELARAGWKTDIHISRHGVGKKREGCLSCGVWAKTNYWHGRITDICIHDHGIFEPNHQDIAVGLSKLIANVKEACIRAVDEFPDSVPCVSVPLYREDGSIRLVESGLETSHFKKGHAEHFPTEAIPEGMESGAYTVAGGHLEAMATAALKDCHVEDSLNPYFGRHRYMYDCKDRDWGYKLRIAPLEFDGTKISFKPFEYSTTYLQEGAITKMISTSAHELRMDLFNYGKNGIHQRRSNGLPPGMITLEEYRQKEEERISSLGVDPQG